MPRIRIFTLSLLLPILGGAGAPHTAAAQVAGAAWSFRTMAAIAGSSHGSVPGGLRLYSGIGLEAGLERRLTGRFALALTARTESREMDSVPDVGPRQRLGSVEFLPVTLQLRYRPWPGAAVGPYVAGGVALVLAWEESGVLDTLDFSPTLGPVGEVGLTRDLSSALTLVVAARSERQRPRLMHGDQKLARIDIDPFTILAGASFRF